MLISQLFLRSVRVLDPVGAGSCRGSRGRLLAVAAGLATLWAGAGFGAEVPLLVVAALASADDGNVPAHAVDGSKATRWSAQGDGQWIQLDLGSIQHIGAVAIAWYQGDQRKSSYDLQGNPVSWNWTFGDGSGSTAQNPSHTYQLPGSYTATLTVRNGDGSTAATSATIQATGLPGGGNLPSEVLPLTNWKLTLPVESSHAGNPDEYLQPELSGFQDANYFHVTGGHDGVVFKAHCGGATTSGSGYPRSEWREMASNGSALASWSTTSGTHTMEIWQAVTHLPVVKPHVVIGQIHNASDDVIVFRLEGTNLFVDQNGVPGPVLTTSYQPGDLFTTRFVARNGGVECYYNGQYIYTYPVSTSGCYFKAGCYTQSNTSKGDAPTASGEVVIYNVTVTHQLTHCRIGIRPCHFEKTSQSTDGKG